MSLSCSCGDDYDYYYTAPKDYSNLTTKWRKRCCSCKNLIELNAIVIKLESYRSPKNDIEERIYGDEVGLAAKYMCEDCADIYFNLDALVFCINIGTPMSDLLAQYVEVYAPKKQAVD